MALWDVKKKRANVREHGVDFGEAMTMFGDPDGPIMQAIRTAGQARRADMDTPPMGIVRATYDPDGPIMQAIRAAGQARRADMGAPPMGIVRATYDSYGPIMQAIRAAGQARRADTDAPLIKIARVAADLSIFSLYSDNDTESMLEQLGCSRTANELREASLDVARRRPDTTGALHHSTAALEAFARELTGQRNKTLGQIIPYLDLPAPLDKAAKYLWGYASEYGRHGREDRQVNAAEAEFCVNIVRAFVIFLMREK